jgi:hypothetical protein
MEESAKRIVRENVSVSRERESCNGSSLAAIAADVILLLHVSLYLIQ